VVSPEVRSRLVSNALIAGFVALQLLIPLRYYLGSDPYDERFSWRMFSAVRVRQCTPQATDVLDGGELRAVDLQDAIHTAWITTLERNRAAVIIAFLERRCRESAVETATFTNQCLSATHEALPTLRWTRDCETGAVLAPESSVLAEQRR